MASKATFFGGMILGAGLSTGALTAAAPGDFIVKAQQHKQITAAQAACYADCAIAAGCWDGNRADMLHAETSRDTGGGFSCLTTGLKTEAPSNINIPSEIVGKVE